MVDGPGKYAVKVPIEKVYDFNTDENNYLEEAQKRHESENPGMAMDANSELAYITKIAGENGYDMVVAEWGGRTRAQTTKELAPTDTQVSEGRRVTKTFDEKYVSNKEKGFVSIVPESKDSKFQKIYDKIYKYRNSQQNYDALYKLSTSSLSREEITKLVNESDLPQDLKDEYNKVDKQRQGKRRSYMKTEVVTVEGAPEGNYLNVGMEIGKDGEMLTTEEIKEALPDDVEVSEELVKNVESEFNGEPSVEPTTILKISRPLTDEEMQNLLVATEQMGISQMVDGQGIVHGTELWGNFDPKFFHMPDSRVLSDVVSKEKTIEQEVEEISNLFSTDINKAVENAKAALANILPNVKFVIHDSYDSYTKAVGDEDVESGGTYMSSTNTIHINKRAATKTTVAHEVFHAVLINMVGTDVKAADITKRMINALSKQLDNNPDLKEYLENFVASYDENIKNEEKAAELFGYLAANYDTLPKQSQSLIKRWMDALAKMFGFKPFTDNEVVDFFNTLSEKVATGKEVTKSDVKVLGDNKKIESKKEKNKKQTSVISNKIKAAKQAGFSDAAISQYLQNNGYTAEQASKGLLDYNKKEIQKAQKEDGIFLKDTNTRIKNFLGNIRRRLASARGFMPKSTFLAIEDKNSKIEVQAKMVSNTSKRFDKLLSEYQGDKEALLVDFDSYIRGDKSIVLPSEFKAVGDIMRNQIDGLSQMLIDLGALPAESAENIRQNIGSYMTRAYEVFDNKDWAKKVKQENVDKVKDFFRTQLLSIATQNAMLSGRSINDEVLSSLSEIQNKTNDLDKLLTEYNKSQSNQNQLIDKVKEISDLMTKYGFKEGKEILDYVLSSGNNINGTKISEKINSFFKRVSVIKNSATNSKTSGIDLNTQLNIDIENQINKILGKDIENGFINSGKEGSKDLSILKQKMDIPLEIRALMGEYTDPIQNYANTVYKMANLAYNTKFLNDLKKNGMGTIFFEENDTNRPKDFNTKIAADSTKTFDPLGGLFTTKEIADEFNKSSKVKSLANAVNQFKGYEYYMKALRSVKWLKTIGSVATHGKNIFGNLDFMLSNGYINFNEYRKSFSVIRNDLFNKGKKDLQEKLLEYIDAGIINQNVGLNEIKSMFKDGDFDKTFERRMNRPGESKISRLGRYLKAKTIGVKEGLESAYQAEDDFFKIVAYETEKKKYSEAFYGKDFKSLNQDEKKDVVDYVKEIVKNTLPNYSRIPNSAKMLKVIPVAGTFISFSLESLRTSYNTVALAFTEMKSDNPKIKAIGAKRFFALTLVQGLKYGLMYYLAASGLDDEDDEESRDKKAKRFVAPWSKNSNIVITDMGEGKFSFIDFSASDPRAQVPKALNAFSSGDNFVDGLVESIKEFTSPYLSQDILFSLVTEITNNEDAFGREIYNEYDKPVDKINKIMARTWKTFEPGTVTSIKKISESENKVNDALGQIFGYKIIDVDTQKQYYFNSKKNFEETLKAKQIYNKAFRKFEKKEITKEELKEAYNTSNESIRGILEENKKDFDSAVYFGADPLVLSQSADDAGYSKSVVYQIESGEFQDIEDKTPLTQEEAMKKIEVLRENMKSRGIKNLDEIRRKAREKGGN
jgi:hypothetical protein